MVLHDLFRGKALERHDGDGLVHLAPGADPLAGMGADDAADPGQGVVLPDDLDRLLVFALGHQGQIGGNVYAGRTSGLAGRGLQPAPGAGGADPLLHMVHVVEGKFLERGVERPGQGALGTLGRDGEQLHPQLLQGVHMAGGTGSLFYLAQKPFYAVQDLAGLGLLLLEGLQVVEGKFQGLGNHADGVVQHLQGAGAHAHPLLGQKLEIKRGVQIGCGKETAGAAAELHRFQMAVFGHAAGIVFHDLLDGGAKRHFL